MITRYQQKFRDVHVNQDISRFYGERDKGTKAIFRNRLSFLTKILFLAEINRGHDVNYEHKKTDKLHVVYSTIIALINHPYNGEYEKKKILHNFNFQN